MDQTCRNRRFFKILPLILVIFGLVVLRGLSWIDTLPSSAEQPSSLAASTIQPSDASSTPILATRELVPTAALAIPWGVLTPATTPVVLAAETPPPLSLEEIAPTIFLQGPPPQAQFGLDDRLSFYWQSDELLADGDYYALYVVAGDGPQLLDIVDEANLGQGFQVNGLLGDVVTVPGVYQWYVTLTDGTGLVTARSEFRSISAGDSIGESP